MTLRELKIGESAVVTAVGGEGALRQHFLDMGLLPGVEVKLLKFAPMGDPMELLVRGYTLSLRLEEAALIEVKKEPKGNCPIQPVRVQSLQQQNLRLRNWQNIPFASMPLLREW